MEKFPASQTGVLNNVTKTTFFTLLTIVLFLYVLRIIIIFNHMFVMKN